MTTQTKKSILWGIIGGLALLELYFLILTLVNSLEHAIEQFKDLWPWMSALIIGFSIQVGLYSYIRQKTKEVVASAGISTGSMIACCAHHLVDVLPILGLSAAFLFLAQYQIWFIILGILSNLVGIAFMLNIIKKTKFMKNLRNYIIIGSAIIILIAFFAIKSINSPESASIVKIQNLPLKIDDQGELSIEIEPIDFAFNQPLQFKVSLNTHQGDLDFDLTQKAVLIDDQNNQYKPLEWQGPIGGHHLSGLLIFPAIQKTKSIKLIIKEVYEIKQREFLWENLSTTNNLP